MALNFAESDTSFATSVTRRTMLKGIAASAACAAWTAPAGSWRTIISPCSEMDADSVQGRDDSGLAYSTYPTGNSAEMFAFLSLDIRSRVSPAP